MGFRFRRSIRPASGVGLNVGLKRTSVSIGTRGVSYAVDPTDHRITARVNRHLPLGPSPARRRKRHFWLACPSSPRRGSSPLWAWLSGLWSCWPS